MSVEAVSWALNDANVHNTLDAMVLVGLANHADPEGNNSFPSLGRLARYARCDERSIRRSIGRLKHEGLIWECDQAVVAAHIERADRRPIGYNLAINGGTESPPARIHGGTQSPPAVADGGTQSPPVGGNGGTLCPPRGDTGSPEPSVEPSVEQEQDQNPLSTAVDDDRVMSSFEQFWCVYPKRNGKKVGKRDALIEWRKLSWDQRRRAYVGAVNLAASDQMPKDAERFLRRTKGGKGSFPFDDWQEPASPPGNIRSERSSHYASMYLAAAEVARQREGVVRDTR